MTPVFDKHKAYEAAVQGVASPLAVLEHAFAQNFSRPLLYLREDFCGTGALVTQFVADDEEDEGYRRGMGVDIDKPVIEWAERNRRQLGRVGASNVELVCADVRNAPLLFACDGHKPDAVVALNHSYFVLHTFPELQCYFTQVYTALTTDTGNDGPSACNGVMLLDAYGGRNAHVVGKRGRCVDDCPPVTRYVRHVKHWDPQRRMCDWGVLTGPQFPWLQCVAFVTWSYSCVCSRC
eukprot:m.259933 g.259933  ORF g.259933 m.259933 type:complete len:236 (+) comp19669_c0_seq17:205-912(+)